MAKFLNQYIGDLVPVGSIFDYVGEIPPLGYMFCDGSPLNTNEYMDLYNVIGARFNSSSIPNTFNLPKFNISRQVLVLKAGCDFVARNNQNQVNFELPEKIQNRFNIKTVQLIYSGGASGIYQVEFERPMKDSNYTSIVTPYSTFSWVVDNRYGFMPINKLDGNFSPSGNIGKDSPGVSSPDKFQFSICPNSHDLYSSVLTIRLQFFEKEEINVSQKIIKV